MTKIIQLKYGNTKCYLLKGTGIHFLVQMKIPCPIFLYKKEAFAVPSLYNQFTTKIMKEG